MKPLDFPATADRQRADDRRRGLLPGRRFRRPHPARRLGHVPCRVERNVDVILGLLADGGAKATFFTLGWVAERYPQLVRRIVDAGHEVASHGFGHQRASEQERDAFLADIRRAKAVLEDIGGPRGHRLSRAELLDRRRQPWAFDCIAEAGYRYSSSIYPIRHDHYGVPDAPRFAHEVRPGLIEMPVATVRMFGNNLPAGGGGYFRLLPYALSRWSIRRVNAVDRSRRSSTSTRGRSIRSSRGSMASAPRRAFATTSTSTAWRRACAGCSRDFRWGRVDQVFLNGAR